MRRIKIEEEVEGVGASLSFTNFLCRGKGSKMLRLALSASDKRESSPFDMYFKTKITDLNFNSRFFFNNLNKIKMSSISNFFLLLRFNKIRSRAQRAHFSDIRPECTGCGQHETIVHLFWDCQILKNCIVSCATSFSFGVDDLLGVFKGQHNAVGAIIMGAIFFSAHIFSCNGKALFPGAARNMAARMLKLAGHFDKCLAKKITAAGIVL